MLDFEVRRGVLLDRETLLARVVGDEELLAELVALFLESCPELLAALREGIARGDGAQVRAAAHALRGSIANFSEGTAVQTARCLEHMGQAGELARAEETLALLETQVQHLQQVLREWEGKPTLACER